MDNTFQTLISPQHGGKYSVIDLIKKAGIRAETMWGFILTKFVSDVSLYGDADGTLEGRVVVGSPLWGESLEGEINFHLPVHISYRGVLEVGFQTNGGNTPWAEKMRGEKWYVSFTGQLGTASETLLFSEAELLENPAVAGKFLELIQSLLVREVLMGWEQSVRFLLWE
jgi:hypothetical protein